MANILINGISAKAGGGKSILVNFLSLLQKAETNDKYIVVVPDAGFSIYARENVLIVPFLNSGFSLFRSYVSGVRKLIKKHNISLVFNLADIIVPVSTRQIYLFDWPYAIYPDSVAWSKMTRKELLFRKFKLFLIRRFMRFPALLIAQTNVARSRLEDIYRINNIEVVPNAVSLDHFSGGQHVDYGLPESTFKLLYLTKYYTHKNIEVFLSMARIIRDQDLPFSIVITIDESQNSNARKFLEDIKKEGLDKIVINVGPVKMEHVPSLYEQTQALLMPSLLESFSGTYVEAMYHGKPIFTSDLDFARVVCDDAAFYFDPLSPHSIIDVIRAAYNSPDSLLAKIRLGKERLNGCLNWPQAFEKYLNIIERYKN